MNDVTDSESMQSFLRRAAADVQRMRLLAPDLATGDVATWHEVRYLSQQLERHARNRDLAVLRGCARELANLTGEKFAGANVDSFLLHCVSSGIETLSMEIQQLLADC